MIAAQPQAALYLRVSTSGQDLSNQRAALLRLAEARGYAVTLYEEVESAGKRRPVLERMLADVRAGRIRAVLVWALDRLERSLQRMINLVLELDRLNVPVISLQEDWLQTAGPVRSLLVSVFGWVAEQEKIRLGDRTRAGLERARAQGKRLGRPPASPVLLGAAADLVRAGIPVAKAARLKGVKRTTLQTYLKRQTNRT